MQLSDTRGIGVSSHPVIPVGEVPCVWMTAGVLTFRLCDRGLRCSDCPLDWALRNTPRPPAGASDAADDRPCCHFPDDLFYHPGHTWVRVLPRGVLAVGLDDFGRRLLGGVRAVRRPDPDARLDYGAPAFTAVLEDGAVNLLAPFAGTVTVVNDALAARPELLAEQPYDDGWVFRAVPANPTRALTELLSGRAAGWWARRDEARLRELAEVARSATGTGEPPEGEPDPLAGVPRAAAERIRSKLLGKSVWNDVSDNSGRHLR